MRIIKLKQRIGKIIMEDELQRKLNRKNKLKKDIKVVSIQLKSCLNVFLYSVLLHKINIAVSGTSNAVIKRHDKKNFNLRKQEYQGSLKDETKQSKNILHNFSSYFFTKDEVEALPYRLEYIPNYTDHDAINTEFELFFSKRHINIPEETLTNIKVKVCSSCEIYFNKKTPYKYK